MDILHSPVVEHAIRLATVAHQSQKRKSSGVPYIAHPMSVCLILMKAGFHEEAILAAAVLHDVVEDTDLTIEQLAAHFSEEVIQYVSEMTEEKETTAGQKAELARPQTGSYSGDEAGDSGSPCDRTG